MTKIAVVGTGGKQYLVRQGSLIDVEKLPAGTAALPDLLSGQPVPIEIIRQYQGRKVRVLKFRAKSRYKRTHGHRQPLTRIRIGQLS